MELRLLGAIWTFVFFAVLHDANQLLLIVGVVLGLVCHALLQQARRQPLSWSSFRRGSVQRAAHLPIPSPALSVGRLPRSCLPCC